MRLSRRDWIVYDTLKSELRCKRCDQSLPIRLPIPLNLVIDLMRVFTKHHKHCKVPQIASNVPDPGDNPNVWLEKPE